MPANSDQTVTIVTSRAIRAGCEEDFERWVEGLNLITCAAPGYRATVRLGQTAGFQHLLFRFDDQATAEAWQASKSLTAHVAVTDGYVACERRFHATRQF
jgi:antibiotic biosynthesis monooxygenase (ABM) superfamily enzyme